MKAAGRDCGMYKRVAESMRGRTSGRIGHRLCFRQMKCGAYPVIDVITGVVPHSSPSLTTVRVIKWHALQICCRSWRLCLSRVHYDYFNTAITFRNIHLEEPHFASVSYGAWMVSFMTKCLHIKLFPCKPSFLFIVASWLSGFIYIRHMKFPVT